MSTIAITGEMTFEVKQMMRDRIDISSERVKKLIDDEKCPSVDLKTFNWSSVNRNTWFICVNANTNEGYYFPICESENRDNNYSRVKNGMSYFISQGWQVFKIA